MPRTCLTRLPVADIMNDVTCETTVRRGRRHARYSHRRRTIGMIVVDITPLRQIAYGRYYTGKGTLCVVVGLLIQCDYFVVILEIVTRILTFV